MLSNTSSPTVPHQRPQTTNRRPPARRPVPAPVFAVKLDNAGTTAWRQNEEPRAKVDLPRDVNVKNMVVESNRISRETRTHIVVLTRVCCIWGDASSVEHAKKLLYAVVSKQKPSAPSGKGASAAQWAKTPSRTPEARRIHERELNIEEKKQDYRRNPAAGASSESTGSFIWPSDDYHPPDVYGRNCEALDPIRLDCLCYIIWDPASGTLKAMGNKSDVEEALIRIRASFFQLTARQMETSRAYVLHWGDTECVHERVDAVDYQHTQVIIPTQVINLNTRTPIRQIARPGKTPRGRGRLSKGEIQDRPDAEKHFSTVSKKVKDQVLGILNKIRFYHGHITMKVRLGTFLLGRYKPFPDGGFDLVEFENIIKDPGFEGSVTQELGDRKLEAKARQHMINTEGFLESQSAFSRQLSQVIPYYTATLTLDPNDGGGLCQLTKSWVESDNDFIVQKAPAWTRLEKGVSAEKCLMETSVVDLDDGLSWVFEITTQTPVPEQTLKGFDQDLGNYFFNIKQKEARTPEANVNWCEFEKTENGQPRLVPRKKWLDLRVAWHYGIADSGYTVEVARTQTVRYEASPSTPPGKEEPIMMEARWTVQVMHQNWEAKLAENANLRIGLGTEWPADLETWFPMDDETYGENDSEPKTTGHVELMKKLFRLQEIIRGKESVHQRMKVD